MNGLNWAFIGVHVAVGAVMALPLGAAFFVAAIPAWLVLSWIMGNALFWMLREAWDHEWSFEKVFSDKQVISEWLAPAISFAFVILALRIVA